MLWGNLAKHEHLLLHYFFIFNLLWKGVTPYHRKVPVFHHNYTKEKSEFFFAVFCVIYSTLENFYLVVKISHLAILIKIWVVGRLLRWPVFESMTRNGTIRIYRIIKWINFFQKCGFHFCRCMYFYEIFYFWPKLAVKFPQNVSQKCHVGWQKYLHFMNIILKIFSNSNYSSQMLVKND